MAGIRQVCASLFSWVNDGSHSAHDDLYISADESVVARYLTIFREAFNKTGHIEHYKMMMGPELVEPASSAAIVATASAHKSPV
jgi:wobble nucleotide-excising tRNase